MKNLLVSGVVALSSLAVSASAQLIGLQYQTNGSAVVGANTAGVIPQSGYNVDALGYVTQSGGNQTFANLLDSTGKGTGISATVSFARRLR